MTSKMAQYQQRADACRALASRAEETEERAGWLSIAEDWLRVVGRLSNQVREDEEEKVARERSSTVAMASALYAPSFD